MSTGKWKERDTPPDYQPTSLAAQIALKHLDLAALDSKRAQVNGELAELYRTIARTEKATPPRHEHKVA